MIVYLHGFRSSPQSNKAQRLKARMAALGLGDLFWCGQLPPSPRAAIALAERQIAAARAPGAPVTVVGSSLGGYYATHLAEKHGLRAVLVNPAVVAHLSLAEFVGTQTNLYTGEAFEFRPEYLDELRALEVPAISRPQDFLLLAETERRIIQVKGERIYVETSSRKPYQATHGFYRARGYQKEAELADYYASGDNKVIYSKLLSP